MKRKPLSLLILCALYFSSNAQMTVSSGTHIVVSSGANINLNDISLNYTNANISGDGKFIFSGSANNAISGSTNINNISLAKTIGSKLSLNSNIALNGSLQFTTGVLDLNGYDLNLGSTGNLQGENANSYATGNTGYIVSTLAINNPSSLNIGGLGLSITSTSNWGTTIIKRGNYALSDGTNQTIKRFFEITPSNNTNLNATLRFYYLDGELNGLQENQFKFLHSENNGTTWANLNNITLNTTANYVEVGGINSLGKLALANSFTTLPLSALSLTGKAQKNSVNLNWKTINEIDVSHFVAEKSYDGKRFITLSQISSKSDLSKDNSYDINDKNPLLGLNYYRITAVDKDGKTTYSNIAPVNFTLAKDEQATIYPNPAVKDINGSFYMPYAQPVKLNIVAISGKVEMSKNIYATAGLNHFSFDINALPTGTYFIQIANSNANTQLKFIKK